MKRLVGLFLFLATCYHVRAQVENQPVYDTVLISEYDSSGNQNELIHFFQTFGISVNDSNRLLYSSIYTWYGTPYRYGGNSSSGIDCSHFTSTICFNAFGSQLSGSSSSFFEKCNPLKGKDAHNFQEGDLVFFRIHKKRISHVGIYLQNGKFVHASTQAGVIISDLSEAYYKKYFYKAGRLPVVVVR